MDAQTITFVLAPDKGEYLTPLTAEQPKALVPFGGVFRVLDFALSNVINSQLRHIYLLTRYKNEQVEAYVREGWPRLSKDFRWDRGEDLLCLPPANQAQGTADAVYQNLAIMERSRADHVLIVAGDRIYQMDYARLLRQHVESGKDLTYAASDGPSANMDVYAFRSSALIELLCNHVGLGAPIEIGKDIAAAAVRAGRAGVYRFSGYCNDLTSLDRYFTANMDLISGRSQFNPYASLSWPIRPLSGTNILQRSRCATNSRVALGARLALCKIANSHVSAGVRVEVGAEIENSLILAGSHIGAGAQIRNAIIGENVEVPAKTQIGFDIESDSRRYMITPDGIVVVAPWPKPRQEDIRRRCARVATKAHSASIGR